MLFSTSALVVPLLAITTAAFYPASTNGTDQLAANGLVNLKAEQARLAAAGQQGNCTLATAHVRKEWSTLSKVARKQYSDAVLCLMALPAKTNQTLVPGAISRYDDFVWTHISQTLTIHGTTNFLSWHRYFVYTYEKALREECGYTGYQPYWNWGKSALNPVNSSYFDGSAYSMGGNGVYEAHNCTEALPSGLNCIPAGAGGGCLADGPFMNMTVNLGPVSPTLAESEDVLVGTGTGADYNPRCLKRDVSVWVSSRWSQDQNSTDLITQHTNISDFQTYMQGDFDAGFYGVHTAGHFTIGGDPGGDIFTSPGDPMFFLHHGQIDRTWWIWQNQDIAARQNAIGGTITLNNSPASRAGLLNDTISVGVNAPDVTIQDMMNTMAGELCYIYA